MIYHGIRIKNKLPKNTTELGNHCKLFLIRARIRLRCEPNATSKDAENALKQIISENHGEVLQIDSVIGG